MAYSLEGDPRLILTVEGSKLNFVGGQPTMDQGLENMVLISLFTSPGWPGNVLFDNPNERIGSDFEQSAMAAINLDTLNRIRNAAERALSNPVFGEVTVEVTNPTSNRIDVYILIKPPGADISALLLQRNGLNWVAQFENPASKRI